MKEYADAQRQRNGVGPKNKDFITIALRSHLTFAQMLRALFLKPSLSLSANGFCQCDTHPKARRPKEAKSWAEPQGELEHTQVQTQDKGLNQWRKLF